MKSRTSSSKLTLLRKDIFRFAPLWGIYLIGGLLVMLTTLAGDSYTGASAKTLAETMGPFSIINMIYAALTAQLLFGDLFQTRLCYAQHALPMRRETWFLTHVASGLLYSFVPHLIAVPFFIAMLGEFWFVAWAWLLAMVLQYLFFFGLATLCMFLTGNRFAMIAVYAILNFGSLIVYWFVSTIYEPLLYGIVISQNPFAWACPVVIMAANSNFLLLERYWTNDQSHIIYPRGYYVVYEGVGTGWGHMAICAGVGILLFGLALLLYRKRKLERAGDFITVKPLEPVFAVAFTLCAGCTFALFADIFGTDSNLIFFIVGLILGWFGGQMLLQRTVRVFRGKVFLKLIILAIVFATTIGLTAWDPAGVTRYVPEPQQVQNAEVIRGKYMPEYLYNDWVEGTDPATIDAVCQIHRLILEEHTDPTSKPSRYTSRYFSIRYTLKNGRQVIRTYRVYSDTKAWEMLAALHSSPKELLGCDNYDTWCKNAQDIMINGHTIKELVASYAKEIDAPYPFDAETVCKELLQAVWTDCQLGYMQSEYFEDKYSEYTLNAQWMNNGLMEYRSWSITERMENCQKWMQNYVDLLKYAQ